MTEMYGSKLRRTIPFPFFRRPSKSCINQFFLVNNKIKAKPVYAVCNTLPPTVCRPCRSTFFPPSVSPRRIRPVRTVTRSVRAAACHCGRHNLSAAVRTYHQPLFCGLTVRKNPKENDYDKRGKSSDNRNKRDRQSVFRASHTFCHKRGFRSFRAKAKI